MKIIGLCGMSGSGKGYVSDIFAQYSIPAINTDKVYRDLLCEENSPCLEELKNYFGEAIIAEDGSLDRKKLSHIVFEAPRKLKVLNSVTHKYIKEKTDELVAQFRKNGAKAVIIDAPVLFESGFDRMCDIKVCVTCDIETSVSRIVKRDTIPEEIARKRLSRQINSEKLRELCDYEIINDTGYNAEESVKKFIKNYIK